MDTYKKYKLNSVEISIVNCVLSPVTVYVFP